MCFDVLVSVFLAFARRLICGFDFELVCAMGDLLVTLRDECNFGYFLWCFSDAPLLYGCLLNIF